MRESKVAAAVALVWALALVQPAPAAAQRIINLSPGGAEMTLTGAAGSHAGQWMDQGAVSAGDSRRDAIIGAPGGAQGRVYILFGGPSPSGGNLDDVAQVVITGPASFGSTTAAGNVITSDSSAQRDLIVAAPQAASGRGIVYIFRTRFREGTRLTEADAAVTITGGPNDHLGTSLATGDLDGDGYRELIIGAAGTDRVYIIYGSGTLASRDLGSQAADTVVLGHPTNGSAIGNVLTAGSLFSDPTNDPSDQLYDVVIGEPGANAIYVIGGRAGSHLPASIQLPDGSSIPASLPAGLTAVWTGVDVGDAAGTTLRVADLDGDKKSDLVVGAPHADGRANDAADTGEAYILWHNRVRTSGSLASADVIVYGGQGNQHLGQSIGTGSVNRDTPDDLVFLMTFGDGGEARLYYGRTRSSFGQVSGNQRAVDFAVPNTENRIFINDVTTAPLTMSTLFEVTGEGASDILLAAPDAANGAGQVFITISPKMLLSTSSISVTLKEGQSAQRSIDVGNPSPITLPWSVAPDSLPWLSVAPLEGSSNSAGAGAFSVQLSSGQMTPGTYTGTVQVRSTSIDLTMTLPVSLTMQVQQSRFAQVDAISGSSSLSVPFTVTGWAIDTASTSGTGVDGVNVYAVPAAGGTRVFLGAAQYGTSRQDVANSYGSRYLPSGFSLSVTHAPRGSFKIVAEPHSAITGAAWPAVSDGPTVTIAAAPSPNDLNGDGLPDLVWFNLDSRQLVYWSMNGLNTVAAGLLAGGEMPAGNWEVRAVADMNGDQHPDLVLQNMSTGDLQAWLLSGITVTEKRPLTPSRLSDPAWRLVAAADFNKDGKTDLIFQNMSQGGIVAWLMNGTTLLQGVALSPARVNDVAWQIVGSGDINGDGSPDLVWQNVTTRVLATWFMDGVTMVGAGAFTVSGPSDLAWQARGLVDLDGDGRVDLIWQHVQLGYLAAWMLDGQNFLSAQLLSPAQVNLGWRLGGPR